MVSRAHIGLSQRCWTPTAFRGSQGLCHTVFIPFPENLSLYVAKLVFTFSVGWDCISCSTSKCFDLFLHAAYDVGGGGFFTVKLSTLNVEPVKVNSEGKKLHS